jgi:hypothetical protein
VLCFVERGVLYCVMCVICVLCLIVVLLPPGKTPFAVKIIIIIIIINKIWEDKKPHMRGRKNPTDLIRS